jgi:transcription antitermination factor NusG
MFENHSPSEDGEAMSKIHFDRTITASGSSTPGAKWFAAYTATHHEKCVLDHLNRRQVEAFLPLYKAASQWKKRPAATLELPLFPNYIFVRISIEERTALLGTPGILSFVGSKQSAWELPEREIETLRHGVHERNAEPHEYLVVGERARVTSGVLAGLEGVIVRRKNNLQIVVSLDNIMRSIAIEVDARELTPVSQPPKQTLM